MEQPDDLTALAAEMQRRYEAQTSPDERRSLGHFGTPAVIANYMATLLSSIPRESVRVLDPGAGAGMLTAAACQRIALLKSPRKVMVEAYETVPKLIPFLEKTLEECRRVLREAGHEMEFTIHVADFVLANSPCQQALFDQDIFGEDKRRKDPFDVTIMNPPYFKLQKQSPHARAMAHLISGQPNIYALFMALGAEALRPGGEMVAITPRSYCNGLYFRNFRRWFFRRMSPRHIHLFESRTAAFREQDVLQENVILAAVKGQASKRVTVTSTPGRNLSGPYRQLSVSSSKVIHESDRGCTVRIAGSSRDLQIQEIVDSWPSTFLDLGLRISTGPIVAFRAKEYLLANRNGEDAVPLLSMHNVRPYRVCWPLARNGKPTHFRVCEKSMRLLLPAKRYVLLRRFSAKEERRRIVSAVYQCDTDQRFLGLENHLNYIDRTRGELSPDEARGLVAIFNSALIDRYFRTISGNTQVNATDIRALPLPPMEKISALGRRLLPFDELTASNVERAIAEEFAFSDSLKKDLQKDV